MYDCLDKLSQYVDYLASGLVAQPVGELSIFQRKFGSNRWPFKQQGVLLFTTQIALQIWLFLPMRSEILVGPIFLSRIGPTFLFGDFS